MELRLHGTYLITGASGELGRVIAPVFREAGAELVLVDWRREEVEAQARDLGARAVVADLGRASEAERAARLAESAGPIAGLLHLVGGFAKHAAWEAGDALYDRLMDSNLRTLFHTVRAVLPGMVRAGDGFIASVATNLVWGQAGGAGMTLYAAAKGAVAHYLAALEREVRNQGVRVTVVFPLSSIDTPLNRQTTPQIDPETWVDPMEVAASLLFAATRGPRGALLEMPLVSTRSSKS
ncbi:MAG TPA: SDR family NAD(P)-dependent oxidoreductase [Thermoanaerobaculaceae bacterium]|nr:SDR family NAD(P)-dependent oxidoreductase [Thermoanaerobaculaceae bacterium]